MFSLSRVGDSSNLVGLTRWIRRPVNIRSLSDNAKRSKRQYMKCYQVLNLPPESSFDDVRNAFIFLAKKFHPDSGSPEASEDKFQEVETAYRTLQIKYSDEEKLGAVNQDQNQVVEHDIQHTAPQHRQYLSFDGYGSGTPAQREKQHQKMRAVQAVDNVLSHRMRQMSLNSADKEKALAVKDKTEARKIKTRFGMDRLVEDLIQESMAKGEFDNLSGKGKPLNNNNNYNPYVDFVTHKINEVLIQNGFTPEWITLQKEIREEREILRDLLSEKRKTIGPLPLSLEDEYNWKEILSQMLPIANRINQKINKYNLLVPMINKQMLQVQLGSEAEKILQNGESRSDTSLKYDRNDNINHSKNETLVGLLSSMFGNKRS